MADNKRIAKNTLFFYIRLLFVMGVMLYTSRVILDVLGVDDFGLYNVVGGLVGMLSFLQGNLSNGTSRFLTYELGANHSNQIKPSNELLKKILKEYDIEEKESYTVDEINDIINQIAGSNKIVKVIKSIIRIIRGS